MAAIVKANASLTAGGLAVLRRSFSTSDRGIITYQVDYVCLESFATANATRFRSGSQPPTPIPSSLASLNLTRTPTLVDLATEILNGLAYFKATYSAGVETDLVITTTSEPRTISWNVIDDDGSRSDGFDYISISVTVTGTNQTIPVVRGDVREVFNGKSVTSGIGSLNVRKRTIETTRQTRNARGEYENSVTSTGIYEADDIDNRRPPSEARQPAQVSSSVTFPRSGPLRRTIVGYQDTGFMSVPVYDYV